MNNDLWTVNSEQWTMNSENNDGRPKQIVILNSRRISVDMNSEQWTMNSENNERTTKHADDMN